MKIFRRHVEKKEKEVAEKKRALAEMEFVLNLERVSAYIDLTLIAQDIKDPQSREYVLALRPDIQTPIQKKTPSGPR